MLAARVETSCEEMPGIAERCCTSWLCTALVRDESLPLLSALQIALGSLPWLAATESTAFTRVS
jgi:hypothetical protein